MNNDYHLWAHQSLQEARVVKPKRTPNVSNAVKIKNKETTRHVDIINCDDFKKQKGMSDQDTY